MLIAERVEQFKSAKLLRGTHKDIKSGGCAMEWASYLAGEPWSDRPKCVCPVIGTFMRSWNDSLSDEKRTVVLGDLVLMTIGTISSAKAEEVRAFMCIDWSVREFTPSWLECCDAARYTQHVASLRSLPEIVSWDVLIAATPVLVDASETAAAAWAAAKAAAKAAAGDAAWAAALKLQWAAAKAAARAAAEAAAWAAAGDAAWDAARAAAWAAAGDAAWDAARAAAWDAAGDAAWDAARAAAWDAAGAAARDDLKPVKEKLQASAVELVKRMCLVTEGGA